MPFYRFHIEVALPQQVVMERIRALVRKQPGFWQSFGEQWKPQDPPSPPFIGSVEEESFKFYRDIRYRNSFLPRVQGRLVATPTGTRVNVIMFLHPFVAVFVTFWLGMVGFGALTIFSAGEVSSLIPAGMFLFGVALVCGGFFSEAFKAKRILSDALLDPAIPSVTNC